MEIILATPIMNAEKKLVVSNPVAPVVGQICLRVFARNKKPMISFTPEHFLRDESSNSTNSDPYKDGEFHRRRITA